MCAPTLHVFSLGFFAGFSCQAKEGVAEFEKALLDIFTTEMREQVRFLFSDSPSEGLLARLPNAVGVAEDLLHLVLRCEYCTGGRRTPCTRAILDIQMKFLNPVGPSEGCQILGRQIGLTFHSLFGR